MENASNALLMAAGILIAILVISLGVGIFLAFSNLNESYSQIADANEVLRINKDFIKFSDREDITIDEIISTVHLAQEYSASNKLVNNIVVGIGTDNLISRTEDKLLEILEPNYYTDESATEKKLYTCGSIEYDGDGIVQKIIFKETSP